MLEEFAKQLKLEKFKVRGPEIQASCPFPEKHLSGKDSTPSFSVNVDKGVFFCFSCQSKGTIEELVSHILGISLSKAVSFLEEWKLDKFSRETQEKDGKPQRPEILSDGLLFYYDKIEDDFVEVYKGYVEDQECLIYPIRNVNNELVGALARSVVGRYHKFLWNTPKKLYFFGENVVEKEKTMVVVEGPGDVVSLRKSGLKNALAIMGATISREQVEKLLSLSSDIIIWLDKDAAGAQGMNVLMNRLEHRANVCYIDPWKLDYIPLKGDAKQVYEDFGPKKVLETVKQAKTLLEHILEDDLCKK